MNDHLIGPACVSGRVRVHTIDDALPAIWQPVTEFQRNAVLYDWAIIVGQLLTAGSHRIGGMYLEFKNVADPDDTVSAPSFDRTDGISYFNGLSGSADKDFLRVPLTATSRTASDNNLSTGNDRAVFYAQTQGAVGIHGKTFSDSSNSKIYGGALVAMPVPGDRTQDVVFSRFYLASGSQQVKLASKNIGLEWQLTFQ